MMKCFMNLVAFVVGLAVIAVAAEIIADVITADCRRIGASVRHIRVRESRGS